MEPASTISSEKATLKCRKLHRSRIVISEKIVAFDVIANLQHTAKSAREISTLLEIPNSTMRSWKTQNSPESPEELRDFISTPTGAKFLQRLVTTAIYVIEYGPSGIRGTQEFLRLSKLSWFVATSNGALHDYSKRIEKHIVAFGANEEKRLAEKMRARKITAGLDEMFRGRHPCLVAIEVVSNFILLEKFTEDRKAETWKQEINTRLEGLPIEIGQVVSDLCGAITAYTKDIGAQHSPDLFHGQYELSKATSAPLASQERAFEKKMNEADAEVKKAIKKYGETSKQAEMAISKYNLRKYGFEKRKKRREDVAEAKKALGEIYHPVNLQMGAIQTTDEVKEKIGEKLQIIAEASKEAGLSQSCMDRIAKAGRAFNAMIAFLTMYLFTIGALVDLLQLAEDQKQFFLNVIFPYAYFTMIIKRQGKEGKEKIKLLMASLEAKIREGPWPKELIAVWIKKAQGWAELFQRSSSCVEGRNGMLSLLYHCFHRLSTSRLKALTVVHNYHIKRADGSTAAERFFEQQHDNLFESLVENVRIPGRPRRKVAGLAKVEIAV
jgi:Family of unknown function (DUF6399)